MDTACLCCRSLRVVLPRIPPRDKWPTLLSPLPEETAQHQTPGIHLEGTSPGRAPPPSPPLPLLPGWGLCGCGELLRRGHVVSGFFSARIPLDRPPQRRAAAVLSGAAVFQAHLSRHPARGRSAVPVHRRVCDRGPVGAALRQPSSLPHVAQKQRTRGSAVELGSAQSWALGPMPVRPRRPEPWPPGAWPSVYSKRPPVRCACSTLPSP